MTKENYPPLILKRNNLKRMKTRIPKQRFFPSKIKRSKLKTV